MMPHPLSFKPTGFLNPLGGQTRALLAGILLAVSWSPAQAGLFDDDEARRAILELRQRVEEMTKQHSANLARLSEDNALLRKALLELQGQIDALRQEQARLRGMDEQRAKDIGDLQKRQREVSLNVDERLRKFEPVKVSNDGQEFAADPAEKREFEAALAVFRKGDFPVAQQAFLNFARLYPKSGYFPSALFWLGNAQFAGRDFKEAVANFRQLLRDFPQHARSPDALLLMASAQIEQKDTRAARKSLEDLIKAYPDSEAASGARDRLSKLK